jgi:simple sugar transport system permease protein
MTAGRGWIAIGLVIFARWNPILALVGGYLFGLMESLNFQAQAVGINVSPFFLGMLPYLFTVLAVVLGSLIGARRLGAPADLGTAYEREEV